jgi:hypothetical protein
MSLLLIIIITTLVINKVRDNYQERKCKVKKYIENFPSSKSINVLYTDENGNLGSTSDVGIDYLNVNINSQVGGNQRINGKTTIGGGCTISGGATVDTLNATTSISSPTINIINSTLSSLQSQINNINNNINNINASLTELKNNTVRKDKVYAIVNDSTGQNTTGNKDALLWSSKCAADAKWKFVQENSGKTC